MFLCYKNGTIIPRSALFCASGEGFRALQTSIRVKGYAPFLNHNPHQPFRLLDLRPRGFPWMKFKSLPVLLKNMGKPCAGLMRANGFDHWMTTRERPGCDDGERMGRPKKQEHEKRSETARFRLTLAEREYIRSQAAAAGMDESEYLRARALGHSVSPARSNRADPALVTELNRIGVNVNQLAAATHMGRDFTRFWQEVGAELRGIITKVVASGS